MPDLLDSDWRWNDKVRVFVSYRRARKDLRSTFVDVVFDDALSDITVVWTDDHLESGTVWEPELRKRLLEADLILLLLTPEYLQSDYCVRVEAATARLLEEKGRAALFAVLLEDCDYASKGLGAMTVLSDGGTALRSSSNPVEALREIGLAIKYAAYDLFEKKNCAIVVDEGDILGRPMCELIAQHESHQRSLTPSRPRTSLTTRGGKILWLILGAMCGLAISLAARNFFGVAHLLPILLVLIVTASVAQAASSIASDVEQRRNPARLGIGFALQLLGMDLLWGAGIGLALGIPFVLLLYGFEALPRAPAMIVACAAVGALLFLGEYTGTRPRRLAVYLELVRAGRRPPNGWLIETLPDELERQQELWRTRPVEKVQIEEEQEEDDGEEAEPDPKRPAPSIEDIDRFLALREQIDKAEREEQRTRWKGLRPQNGTRLRMVALMDPNDEDRWHALHATLCEEGLDDLCEVETFRIDEPHRWNEVLAGAAIAMPLLSRRFAASPATDSIAAALSSEMRVYPIRLEELGGQSTRFAARQCLPEHGSLEDWAILPVAYQNIARTVIQQIGRPFRWPDGFPPLKRSAWDVGMDTFENWMRSQPVLGGLTSLFVWLVARHWSLVPAALAMTIAPLAIAVVELYREEKIRRDFEIHLPDGAFRVLVELMLPRVLTTALVAIILYPLLFAVSGAATTFALPRALSTFVDVGAGGGVLFAVFGYLASRRRRPIVLQKRTPPPPLTSWTRFRDGVLTVRAAYTSAERDAMGTIGDIGNKAPIAVESAHHEMRFSIANMVRVAVEVIVFTTIAWTVFVSIVHAPGPRLFRLWLAAWFMLLSESLLLTTYAQFDIYLEERRRAPRLASLWGRLTFEWRRWLDTPHPWPFHRLLSAVILFEAIALVFRAPIAAPVVTIVLAAVITALPSFLPRHTHQPYRADA